MSNLIITEHFIGSADLVFDIKKYTLQMNSLQYEKRSDNVYDILSPEYHDFADIFQAVKKQSLSARGSYDYIIDLKSEQQPSFRKLYSMSSSEFDALRIYLDKVMKADIIHKLILSAASSVMFVPKSDSSL